MFVFISLNFPSHSHNFDCCYKTDFRSKAISLELSKNQYICQTIIIQEESF